MRTSHRVPVSRAPEDVFAYLADVANEVHWRSSIVGSRYVDGTTPAIGRAGETDVEMGPRALTMRWAVTAFDPEARFVAWELDGDPWKGGGSYRVDPDGKGARITGTLEVRLQGAARLLEPIVGLSFRRGLRTDLARLAALLPTIV